MYVHAQVIGPVVSHYPSRAICFSCIFRLSGAECNTCSAPKIHHRHPKRKSSSPSVLVVDPDIYLDVDFFALLVRYSLLPACVIGCSHKSAGTKVPILDSGSIARHFSSRLSPHSYLFFHRLSAACCSVVYTR